MIVRLYQGSDYKSVAEIHKNHHAKDFDLNDFLDNNTLERIVVENDNSNIVTAATIRTILEVTAITDMNASVRERREALIRLLQAITFIAKRYGYDSIHCFPLTSDEWIKHLKEYGFKETKGTCLSMEV